MTMPSGVVGTATGALTTILTWTRKPRLHLAGGRHAPCPCGRLVQAVGGQEFGWVLRAAPKCQLDAAIGAAAASGGHVGLASRRPSGRRGRAARFRRTGSPSTL